MTTTYGHRQLNLFFKELFETTDNGIKYKGKEYPWGDIKKIEITHAVNLCYPRAKIFLNDGEKIWVNGRVFTKAGEKPHFKLLAFFTGESEAFSKFLELVKEKTKINTYPGRCTGRSAGDFPARWVNNQENWSDHGYLLFALRY